MEFDFPESIPQDKADNIPADFRSLYTDGGDGNLTLADDFKPVAQAVLGLNKTVKATREENKSLKGKAVDLSPLQDFGQTPDEIAQAFQSKVEELQAELAKGDDAKLNLDKVRKELSEAHQKELQAREKRNEALQGQLYQLMVKNEAQSAIAEAKGIPDLLMPFVEKQVKVQEENGEMRVYVVDEQGDQRYNGVTGQPMTVKDLVAEMKGNEKFGRLFESDTPSGGGTNPRNQNRRPPSGGDLTPNQKIAMGLNQRR